MRLKYDMLIEDLDKTFGQMIYQEINISTVVHISKKTRSLGLYFAKNFNCGCIQLPSTIRKGKNSALTSIVNSIYPFLPESILKSLSHQYKKLYSHSERSLPSFNLDQLTGEGSILLVDDNCFTGQTFKLWEEEIKKQTGRDTKTFSITVTGDCKPDFYCIEGWRSFEWRPIGI